MTPTLPTLYILRIETTRQATEAIETGLEAFELDVAAWYDQDRDYVRLEIYFTDRAEADRQLARLQPCLAEWAGPAGWSTEICTVKDTDWSEYWKRFFHLTRVSPRILIKPSWETHEPAPGEVVIELDPGMAFGTGQHFSTASCLQLLEPVAPTGGSFLDLGCGSGILSIAAAKLGFGRILALDNDPNAVVVARENAARNGVTGNIQFMVQDLDSFKADTRFDVVVANMFSEVLTRFAPAIADAVSQNPSGHLIVAGILTPQYAGVQEAYTRLGLRQTQTLHDHEWTSGRFQSQSA